MRRQIEGEGVDKFVYEKRTQAYKDCALKKVNLREKDAFLAGRKRVAIISDAASAGISLHSDRRFENRDKRTHITLELAWSADKAVQQLGRTHRSNQQQPPEYKVVLTNAGGEQRFVSAVAKRLQSLGALTQGDRLATDRQNLSAMNLQTKYGRDAIRDFYSIVHKGKPYSHTGTVGCATAPAEDFPEASYSVLERVDVVRGAAEAREELVALCSEEGGCSNAADASIDCIVCRQLMMGQKSFCSFGCMEKHCQEVHGEEAVRQCRRDARRNGERAIQMDGERMKAWRVAADKALNTVGLDPSAALTKKNSKNPYASEKDVQKFLNRILGMELEYQRAIFDLFFKLMEKHVADAKRSGEFDYGMKHLKYDSVKLSGVRRTINAGRAQVQVDEILCDRGIPWEKVASMQPKSSDEGFYMSKTHGLISYCVVKDAPTGAAVYNTALKERIQMIMYKPHIGRRELTLRDLHASNRKITHGNDYIQREWKRQYDFHKDKCCHMFWYNKCTRGPNCEQGKRVFKKAVVTGALLPLWKQIHKVVDRVAYERHQVAGRQMKAQAMRTTLDDGSTICGLLVDNSDVSDFVDRMGDESGRSSEAVRASEQAADFQARIANQKKLVMQYAQDLFRAADHASARQRYDEAKRGVQASSRASACEFEHSGEI